MSDSKPDRLDSALATLSRDIKLETDLWPKICAAIETDSRTTKRRPTLRVMGQLAAGLALVITSSATTYLLTRVRPTTQVVTTASNTTSPINFDSNTLGPGYTKARADLESVFAHRIASLSPDTRVKLLNNVADLRRVADEIAATLTQHPTDPLLQELLISTRQRELQLLADVDQLTLPNLQKTRTET